MPHFTLQVGPNGPVVDALVAVSSARLAALRIANEAVPAPVAIRALIDTGASNTCIEPSVLQSLHLSPTGQISVTTPTTGGTPMQCDQYDVGILIPSGSSASPFMDGTVMVMAAQPSSLHQQGIQGLIGRAILSKCLLQYNGDMGFFTLAY